MLCNITTPTKGLKIFRVHALLNRKSFDKAELLQLNRTQFPSLGIFVGKKVGNQKTKTTFIISVLKGGLRLNEFGCEIKYLLAVFQL